MNNLNIVLLGKTGHGKSATGNTLLGRNRFEATDNIVSTTKMIEKDSSVYNNITIQVFDTPGPFETRVIDESNFYDVKATCENMNMLMRACWDTGVSAFFFVFSRNARYTREEIETFNILESIFGNDAIVRFGVLIITHSENTENNVEALFNTQYPPFNEFFNKFGERYLLITNVPNTLNLPNARTNARDRMIQMAQQMKRDNGIYMYSSHYASAAISRELLVFRYSVDEIKRKKIREIKELSDDIERHDTISKTDETEFILRLRILRAQLIKESKGTEELNILIDQLDQLNLHIKNKVRRCSIV